MIRSTITTNKTIAPVMIIDIRPKTKPNATANTPPIAAIGQCFWRTS